MTAAPTKPNSISCWCHPNGSTTSSRTGAPEYAATQIIIAAAAHRAASRKKGRNAPRRKGGRWVIGMALGYIRLALNDADQSELLAIMVSVGRKDPSCTSLLSGARGKRPTASLMCGRCRLRRRKRCFALNAAYRPILLPSIHARLPENGLARLRRSSGFPGSF